LAQEDFRYRTALVHPMMSKLYLVLGVVLHTAWAASGEDSCSDSASGVCLLQGGLRPSTVVASCPGNEIAKPTVSGTCQCSGVTTHDINYKQADNVDIETITYYINGEAVGGPIANHFFQQGPTEVKAVYKDFQGLKDTCNKEVGCLDKEPPTWKATEQMVDAKFEIDVGPNCKVNLGHAMKRYATMEGIPDGVGKGATDNCGLALSTVSVYSTRTGERVYNDSVTVADGEDLLGPGLYDVTFTATDTSGNSIQHETRLTLQDRTPPSKAKCPAPIKKMIKKGEGSVEVTWEAPYAEEDNCKPYGFFSPGTDDEGKCDPLPGTKFVPGVHPVTCTVTDRVVNNDYDGGELQFNYIPCQFTVTVEVEVGDPVTITCPTDPIETVVYPHAAFGVPDFAKAVATHSGGSPVVMEYYNARKDVRLQPGDPFDFGTTTVIAKALGAPDSGLSTDHNVECSIKVTVTDVYNPKSDGGQYRCADPSHGGAEPFGICEGTRLQTTRATSFPDSHEYAIDSSNIAALTCCTDEEGTEYECKQRNTGDSFKYCQPKTLSTEETTATPTTATQPATAESAATESTEAKATPATPAETPTDAAEETGEEAEDVGMVEIARLQNLLHEKERELLENHRAPGKHGEDSLPPVGHKGRHHGKHNLH